jgi:hypothetical protein
LQKLAGIGTHSPKATVIVGLVLFAVAVTGVTNLKVNNNLVEWFKKDSEVRIADTVINKSLGGTSLGYVVAVSGEDDYIKTPEAMQYIEGLQQHIEKLPVVGKTTSVVDYVKRINRVLHDDDPKYNVVPETKEMIGQYIFLFSMSAKPSDLDNVVDYPFKKANIWVQLKTWDAQAMRDVIKAVDDIKISSHYNLSRRASVSTRLNDEVLWDMVRFIFASDSVLPSGLDSFYQMGCCWIYAAPIHNTAYLRSCLVLSARTLICRHSCYRACPRYGSGLAPLCKQIQTAVSRTNSRRMENALKQPMHCSDRGATEKA